MRFCFLSLLLSVSLQAANTAIVLNSADETV